MKHGIIISIILSLFSIAACTARDNAKPDAISSGQADQATVYVAPNGDDKNPGTKVDLWPP